MHTCMSLLKAQHLIPADYVFGPRTPIPGLEPVLLPNTLTLTPALWAKGELVVSLMVVVVVMMMTFF